MDHRPQAWGRPRDDVYGPYDSSYFSAAAGPKQAPMALVTGTSVLGLKFSDGVVLAADNLASYGSLARFSDVGRLHNYANTAVVGFGGDIADMQQLNIFINNLVINDAYQTDDMRPSFHAASLHHLLARHLYSARTRFKPFYTHVLVAGLDDDGKPYLGSADIRGTSFTSPSVATNFGSQLAQPLMRKHVPDEEAASRLSRDEAVDIIKECMKVLFYRDARSSDSYSIAIVTQDGVDLRKNEKLEKQSWAFAETIKGYGS